MMILGNLAETINLWVGPALLVFSFGSAVGLWKGVRWIINHLAEDLSEKILTPIEPRLMSIQTKAEETHQEAVKANDAAVKANDAAVKANDAAVKANDAAIIANDVSVIANENATKANEIAVETSKDIKNIIGTLRPNGGDSLADVIHDTRKIQKQMIGRFDAFQAECDRRTSTLCYDNVKEPTQEK